MPKISESFWWMLRELIFDERVRLCPKPLMTLSLLARGSGCRFRKIGQDAIRASPFHAGQRFKNDANHSANRFPIAAMCIAYSPLT